MSIAGRRVSRALARAASIDDLREIARRRLPAGCFDWADGGANAEVTLRANRSAFERIGLRARQLVDVSSRDQSTTVCGSDVSSPILLAPVGLAGIIRPGAEALAARAAGGFGTVYCLSSGSSVPLEAVAAAATGPLWFQAYLWRGGVYEQLIRRAAASGYETLVVTVDTPVSARRRRDIRNGFTIPPSFSTRQWLQNFVRHPGWTWDFLRAPEVGFANLSATSGRAPVAEMMDRLHDPSATDVQLSGVRDLWSGRLLVKGILSADDAVRALACGADGVIVSNHGGRQLDGAPATLAVLPEVVEAVGSRSAVLIDGGIRSGADVVKAIALGADAVLIGRPYLYGAAVGGEDGVLHALQILYDEVDTCLGLLGRTTIRELDRSAIVPQVA